MHIYPPPHQEQKHCRCVFLVGLNRLENSLPQRPPSRVPRAWSLPSGQDVLARQLSRRPAGLTFALVCVALRCRATFVVALWWQRLGVFALALSRRRLDFWFVFCPRSGMLALALSWQRLRFWLVDFALALPWQRLWQWLRQAPAFPRHGLHLPACVALCSGCPRL